MTTRGYILLALVLIGVVLVLLSLRNSPPAADPMRTADQRQIERETAAIQRNESAYDFIDELLGLVRRLAWWIFAACSAIGTLIFIASKTI